MSHDSFIKLLDLFISMVRKECKKKNVLSKKTVEKLCCLRGLLADLCPETDGLQEKDRIKRVPIGLTRKEQASSIVEMVYKEFPSQTNGGKDFITQRSARFVSLVYTFKGFSFFEVYKVLKRENKKNYF